MLERLARHTEEDGERDEGGGEGELVYREAKRGGEGVEGEAGGGERWRGHARAYHIVSWFPRGCKRAEAPTTLAIQKAHLPRIHLHPLYSS